MDKLSVAGAMAMMASAADAARDAISQWDTTFDLSNKARPPSYNRLSQKGRRKRARQERSC